ncbi:DUF4382 domain-containing protein [filamentous cyanobacterium CCP5]|nr:DUF4382 domain-containing protein [filamentous cyanobacterium CCP5]
MAFKFSPLKSVGFVGTVGAIALQACSGAPPQADNPSDSESTAAETAADGTGTLVVRANGEDFVRQGFTTKDGWDVSFDHLYVTLADVTAYQADPAYEPEKDSEISAKEQVSLGDPITVDLAEGDDAAEPIQVAEVEAPAGRYNALAWEMVPAASGPAEGYPLMLVGTATKAGETVDFTLKMSEELGFSCGDFVGEERKGILTAGETADVEATFHFDHLFGDGEAPPDDEINTGALGFDPLAALATDGQLEATSEDLEQQLSDEQYQTLLGILPSLGHVGEGHCEETQLTT